jgi:hypothetical protein
MRVLSALLFVMLCLASPISLQRAAAQMDPYQLMLETERRARIENEKKYDETMKRIRSGEPAAKKDPWSKIRKDEPAPKR